MITKERKISKSFLALTLVLVMFLTNILGAGEVSAQTSVPKPTINPVAPNAQEITGGGLVGSGQRKRFNKDCIIHVTVKDENDIEIETADVSIKPKGGSKWKVTLKNKVKAGYKVYAKQEFNGGFSDEVFVKVKQLLSELYKGKLSMPTLEVWSEDTFVIDADAVEDIVKAFKTENNKLENVDDKNFEGNLYVPKNANDKINPIDVAGNGKSIDVTFSDKSKLTLDVSDKVTVHKITEISTAPIIDTLKVVDSKITGRVDLTKVAAPERLRVEIVTSFGETKPSDFCTDRGCSIDKGTKIFATVNPDTGEFSYEIGNDNVVLGKDFGVIVKEYGKKNNCKTIQPELVIPDLTGVRDPRKLTDKDKEAIGKAIRDANTVNDVSKLPDGTGDWDGMPAVIQFDDSGNVKIFSGNDVAGTWDPNNNYKFVPETNEDGSYKVNEGAEPTIIIPAKDLVKNIKPDAPTLALSEDKKNITITPNLEVDTDAHIITVSYKDKDGNDQTTTATKADDGTWSITKGEGSVDDNGVITLPKDKVKGGTDVTATVTDKGGIADDDKDPLTSEPGTLTIKETIADKVEALGGLDPVDIKKWVGDTVEWKKGVKAKDSATDKDKIQEYINGATVTDVSEPKIRTTNNSGDFEGKVKVKFDDDSEIIVEKQMLYVSDLVSPSDKKNLPDDAIDVELKLGEGVKAGEVEGSKETPVTAKTYKVKPGTDLSTEKVSKTEKTCFEDVGAIVTDDTYVDLTWNDKNKGKDFKATAENNVFTATATKKFKVTVQANGGTGDDKVEYKKSGENFTLPAKDTFTPPENKEFDGWEINGEAKKVGDKITVTEDTTVTAKWKDKSGDQDPNDPGKQDPNDPGKQDPNDPGKQDPNDPGKQDPNDPGTKKPNEKPENGGRVQPWPGYWWYFGNNTDPIQATEVKTQEKQEEIEYNNHERYMYGYPDGTVRPEGMMTRAEAAALIARLAKLDMSNDAKPNFQDTESAWYNSAINAMTSKNLMFADKDGNFRPNQAITRAEFARALYGVDKKNDKVAPFEDVKGHEFEAAINQAYGNGRINGYPDGTFKPDAYIQRSEAARILNQYANRGVDFDGLAGVRRYLIKFTDIDESHWAYYEIMEATNSHEYKRARGKQIETWLQILNK
ncbi:S-layer homology domain-containing protein [Peptoniphilus obesi]|uniref:S-layer homology domain-containing protein n=1 Tax=Peptoniphilus obesi TaxID=1472765 RepID=UPI0004B1D5F9|nr:S-layer homology domain-containing protein [Peptoniphilus obesi]